MVQVKRALLLSTPCRSGGTERAGRPAVDCLVGSEVGAPLERSWGTGRRRRLGGCRSASVPGANLQILPTDEGFRTGGALVNPKLGVVKTSRVLF